MPQNSMAKELYFVKKNDFNSIDKDEIVEDFNDHI